MRNLLYVPVNVQALVVHDELGDCPFDLVPVPRTNQDLEEWYLSLSKFDLRNHRRLESSPGKGVHLHWTLPAALTRVRHGKENGDGAQEPEQPCIPNRWLIVRMSRHANAEISSRGWVMESDFVSSNDTDGIAPFPFLGQKRGEKLSAVLGKDGQIAYVGRKVPLADWTEEEWTGAEAFKDPIEQSAPYRFDIKPTGWGDPAFAAYYPACKGVLGFHDEDVVQYDLHENVQLTYLVAGWYSDPKKDPLFLAPPGNEDKKTLGKRLNDHLQELGWACAGLTELPDPNCPNGVLLHGAVVGLEWREYNTLNDPPESAVAIGGSSAEAIVALVAHTFPDSKNLTPAQLGQLEQVLCAFQYGQAQQIANCNELADLLHRQSFNAAPGGIRWSLKPAEWVPVPSTESPPPSLPPLPSGVPQFLSMLNAEQQKFDRETRKLQSRRWKLFALWAAWATKQHGGDAPDRDEIVKAEEDGLKADATRLETIGQVLAGLKRQLSLAIGPSGMQLAESAMPPFLQPKDPFILAQNDLARYDRLSAAPDPVRYQQRGTNEENLLRCRLREQLIKGATRENRPRPDWAADKIFPMEELRPNPSLESGWCDTVKALAREALLFEPNNTDWATKGARDETDIRNELALIQVNPEAHGVMAWDGTPPDAFAITGSRKTDARPHTNPWLPLFLRWEVAWTPDYRMPAPLGGARHRAALTGWTIDATSDGKELGPTDPVPVDLVPIGATTPSAKDEIINFTGATLLSNIGGTQLKASLEAYLKKSFDKDHQPSLGAIEATNAVGQALGGLNDLMLGQTLGLFLPPVGPNNVQIDSVWGTMDRVRQTTLPLPFDNEFRFQPVRRGALDVTGLSMVDTFGQVRSLKVTGAETKIFASTALLPSFPSTLPRHHARFPPRLIQPARLNFDWDPGTDAEPGPVHGWIVPNFLDKGLDVFDASGTPIGTLDRRLPRLGRNETDQPMTLVWRPVPASGPPATPDQIRARRRLTRFVEMVTGMNETEGRYFIELIDLVARKADGWAPAEDPLTAVLFGRPLAFVGATLGLEFQGDPAGYWNTEKTPWVFEDEGVADLRVEVRLGGMGLAKDGLVGYWLESSPDQFVATWRAPVRNLELPKLKYRQDLAVDCADNRIVLTMLLDAGARVHATTGMLPRHAIELPPEVAKQAGQIQDFYVPVAPVLGERTVASGPVMPRPSDSFGNWSWSTRPNLTYHPLRAADDRARFVGDLALSEGWLKLSRNKDAKQPK